MNSGDIDPQMLAKLLKELANMASKDDKQAQITAKCIDDFVELKKFRVEKRGRKTFIPFEDCVACLAADDDFLQIRMVSSDKVAEKHRDNAMRFINAVNWGLQLGHFYMDPSDGEYGFSASMFIPQQRAAEITAALTDAFALSVYTFSKYSRAFTALKTGTNYKEAMSLTD